MSLYRLIFYDDTTTTLAWDWAEPGGGAEAREELVRVSELPVPSANYSAHPGCGCWRVAASLPHLQRRFSAHSAYWAAALASPPLRVPAGVYIGPSSCDQYTSALGSGQKVLSYTYYSPWRTLKKQYELGQTKV